MKKMKSDMQHKHKQFIHESKRREKEMLKLKERLNQVGNVVRFFPGLYSYLFISVVFSSYFVLILFLSTSSCHLPCSLLLSQYFYFMTILFHDFSLNGAAHWHISQLSQIQVCGNTERVSPVLSETTPNHFMPRLYRWQVFMSHPGSTIIFATVLIVILLSKILPQRLRIVFFLGTWHLAQRFL